MTDSIFREGGPHNFRRKEGDLFEASVSLPTDEHGMIGRRCQNADCSPAYFKVRPGTGLAGEQTVAYCPYCHSSDHPNAFATQEQQRYARDIVLGEATNGVNRMVHDALRLGPTGKRRLGGGMFSIEMSLTPALRPAVSRPLEEELRRDITCPACTLTHAVFGLATWCPDCGADVFLQHLHEELTVTRKILQAVDERRERFGARVAARDVENALEDVVSLFEATLKHTVAHHLRCAGTSDEEIEGLMIRRVRNTFQNITPAVEMFRELTGRELLGEVAEAEADAIRAAFEKRHPITHNLGVIDRKYLARVRSTELRGREIRVNKKEVATVLEIVERILRGAYESVANRIHPA